jgi:hypothetical protein
MKGPAVKMILSKEVSSALCEIDQEYKAYLRGNGTILVQLTTSSESIGTLRILEKSV